MSRWRWALACGLCAALLTVLLLALDGRQQRVDPLAALGHRDELRRLEALAAALDRELLRCRAGLTSHHDDLARVFGELREVQDRLLRVTAGAGFMPGPELSAALLRVSSLSREQRRRLDRFQSENARLLDSRRALPRLLEAFVVHLRAAPGSEQASARLSSVLVALSYLDVAPLPDALVRLNAALDGLERAAPPATGWPAEAALLLQHARWIAQRSPLVDELVMQLLNLPLADAVRGALLAHQRGQAEAVSRWQLRKALSAGFTALAVLLGLALVILQLRDDERARRRAEQALRRGERALEGAHCALERERQRLQARLASRFVAGIAREFRAPLTSILSSSRMLGSYGERWSSERRQEHFDRISACAAHLKEALEELLLIGRADAGELVASPALLDLQGFCEHLIESRTRAEGPLSRAEPRSRAQGAAPRVRFSFRGDRKVCLDQRLLTHVLGNLLDNALQYSSPEREVGLHVTVSASGVRCVVQDSGVGIRPEELPRLFQTFWRGRDVRDVPGSGLGLAVVRRALQVQGGKIEVRSAAGRGSEFVIWLPLSQRPTSSGRGGANDAAGSRTMELDTSEIELLPLPELQA